MLAFREIIMDIILHIQDSSTIEYLIKNLMHQRFENVPSERNRFLKLFNSDTIFQLQQIHNDKMERNLIETQRVLKVIIRENNVTTSRKKKNI